MAKGLTLAALAVLGLCTVSIPVTLAVLLSATGTSDVLVLGDIKPAHEHATPDRAVAGLRCVPRRGYYALTFDDGPVPETTPRLAGALRRSNAIATFFDIGRAAAARPDLVEQQRRVGQVANHSYSHPPWAEVSSARRIQEMQVTARILDYPSTLFRPPGDISTPATEADVRRTGLTTVLWTLDTADRGADARAIVDRAADARPGEILLLHDGAEATIAAVPKVVAALRRRGMCPGFLGATRRAVRTPDGVVFHASAVAP